MFEHTARKKKKLENNVPDIVPWKCNVYRMSEVALECPKKWEVNNISHMFWKLYYVKFINGLSFERGVSALKQNWPTYKYYEHI